MAHPARARSPSDYYGGFLLDPDGNSVEAVHTDRERPVPNGRIDHLWLRIRDPQASRRFYTTIAPHAGLRVAYDARDRVQLSGPDFSSSLVRDERPFTEHVHLAFPADTDPTVQRFHAAALASGFEDHGTPRRAPHLPPGLLRRLRARPGRPQRRGRQPQPLSHGQRVGPLAADLTPITAAITQIRHSRRFESGLTSFSSRPKPAARGGPAFVMRRAPPPAPASPSLARSAVIRFWLAAATCSRRTSCARRGRGSRPDGERSRGNGGGPRSGTPRRPQPRARAGSPRRGYP
jgi:catechol 2,3-dioxygenase-like lactoylglutathione lyase family enzyme